MIFYIGNQEWTVIFVPPMSYSLQRQDGTYTYGSCDNPTHTIYIQNGLSEFMLWRVLCHEITHTVLFSYNIDLNLYEEEVLADLIATYGGEILMTTEEVYETIKRGF